jgi:hypothetical protein
MNTGSKLHQNYIAECNAQSDINEHLPTLKHLADECDTVIEMGVRSVVSTWAFLVSKCKNITSYDIQNPSFFPNHTKTTNNIQTITELAKSEDKNYTFIKGDTLKITIPETDLLFIDTYHVYDQLIQELKLHGNKARKYIVLHDTEKFGTVGEHGKQGLNKAVNEFIDENDHWKVEYVYKNNNGLTVLRRKTVVYI